MIGIRLSQDHERKLCALAREAGMKPSPFARRVLIAFLESQAKDEKDITMRLSRIEEVMRRTAQAVLQQRKQLARFLENVDIVDPA